MSVEPHLVTHRRMRPLRTIHSFTDGTSDADRIKLAPFRQIELVSIGDVAGVMEFAAESDGNFGAASPVSPRRGTVRTMVKNFWPSGSSAA